MLTANSTEGLIQNLASPSGWDTCTCGRRYSLEKKKSRNWPSLTMVGDMAELCVSLEVIDKTTVTDIEVKRSLRDKVDVVSVGLDAPLDWAQRLPASATNPITPHPVRNNRIKDWGSIPHRRQKVQNLGAERRTKAIDLPCNPPISNGRPSCDVI